MNGERRRSHLCRKYLVLATFFLSASRPLAAASNPSEPLRPPLASDSPRIDGRLDEPVWSSALVIDDFVQREPREGDRPSERTEVRILYTPTELYVAFRAFDSRPDSIVATARKRDDFRVVENDQFALAIDSYNDGRNGFWFSTNPLGVRVDAQFFEEGERWLGEWNGIWDCASRVDERGWTAEMRIPFSTLRFKAGPQNVMGLNLFRRIIRTSEGLFSPLIPLSYAQGTPDVSIARKLAFRGLARGRQLWFRPYALGGFAREEDGSGNTSKTRRSDVGGDLTWALTPSLTGSLTVNTDFALTELDDRQINLTRYDLFFPERRDFFLETGGLFAMGVPEELEVFFSRRIGLETGSDGRTQAVPILAGTKLTGRIGPLEVGALDVVTEATALRPAENFVVLRTKRGIGARSYVGLMGTHKVSGDASNAVLGADATVYLLGQVGATGFVAVSRDENSAGHNAAHGVTLFKGGEREAFELGYLDVGRGFHPEIGFVRRPGIRRLSGDVRLPWYFQNGRLRRLTPLYVGEHVRGADGFVESWSHEVGLEMETRQEDFLALTGGVRFDRVAETFPIFRTVRIPEGSYETAWLRATLRTKPGRRVAGEVTLLGGGLYDGQERTAACRVSLKASRSLTGSASWTSSWIRRPAESFRTEVAQARVDYAPDTHLSASALVQYDNASRDLGLDLRLRYELREGTALALVYSEVADRDAAMGPERLFGRRADRSIILKLTYLFGL